MEWIILNLTVSGEYGEYKGIDVELAKEAFQRLGYQPKFENIVWEDKDELLADGTIDCLWSSYSMNGREDKYQWAGPYLYSRQMVAVRKESEINTNSGSGRKEDCGSGDHKGRGSFPS